MILLTELIVISHKHIKKFMVFEGDQNKRIIKLLELNNEYLIFI